MFNELCNNLEKNIDDIKESFKDCDDITYRGIEVGEVFRIKITIVYISGLTDKDYISEYVIGSLLATEEIKSLSLQGYRTTIIDAIAKEGLYTADIALEKDFNKIIDHILAGDTVLLIEGMDQSIVIDTKGWVSRGISEPQTETVIRGPREGFVESLKVNTTMVRRRIKDTNLKIKMCQVGRRSKTSIAIMYIDDIVNKRIFEEVEKRLTNIDIDAILDSSILENLIEDNYLSPFPQIENTERPDAVAASLLEGRVALIVDNSPFALVVPATLGTLLQSSEDYYTRWSESTLVRLVRLVAMLFAFLPPALYIATSAYHPGVLPSKLIYYLAASRLNVPFPSVIEAGLMELTMELLREAGTRTSGPIGMTIGIVGGLIIGQAAVEAGIVSPLMIIIVAITTISTFAIPSYELASALRLTKFFFIIAAGIFGLYGIMIGVIILGTHLATLSSFGIPYTSPYSGLGIKEGDLKDTLIKGPIQGFIKRPGFTKPRDKIRMKRRGEDE